MIFLGFKKIDFTDEKTNKRIVGYHIYVGNPISYNGAGVAPLKFFIKEDLILSYSGSLSDYINCPITLTFDYKGKVTGIDFDI